MIPRSVGTHNGSFHADEVSACALLVVFDLVDRTQIYRTRNPDQLKEYEYVCDVGGVYDPLHKRFDHHQVEYTGNLSSAGMVWKYFLDQHIIDQPTYEYFNRAIIIGIDAHDNGIVLHQEGVTTFSHVIANFSPVVYGAEEEDHQKGFFEALGFAIFYFHRLLQRYRYICACQEIVAKEMAKKAEVLLFEQPIAWQDNFFDLGGETHPALFVIMPSQNHWKLRGIPPNRKDKMQVRLPLPQKWAGLRNEELQKMTGISGAIFCHKGRFISVWETKEDALEALELILKEEKKK